MDEIQQKIPKHKHKNYPIYKPWWNTELKHARKETTLAEKKWLSYKDTTLKPLLRDHYKHARKKNLVRWSERPKGSTHSIHKITWLAHYRKTEPVSGL